MSRDGMKMKKKRNNLGFSLPELIIGMAIFVLVLALVNAFLSTGLTTYKYTMSQEHSIAKGRTAFNLLVDKVRYSKVILPSAVNDEQTQLKYEEKYKPDGNPYGTPIEVTVTVDNTTKTLGFSDGKSLAEGVAKSLKVTKESENQFTIELTLNDASYAGSPDVVYKSRVQCFNM